MYILTYYAGTFYQALFVIYLQISISAEVLSVGRNPKKDKETGMRYYEIAYWSISFLVTLPVQIMNYNSLMLSGVTRQEYPTLHYILFDYNMHIFLALSCIWFITFTLSLNPKYIRYQLAQFCFTVFIVGYGSIGAPSFAMLSRYGRFWYFFPQQAVAFNDIAAYTFGKLFGKTKLIKVSPNKTVEGFLGGVICNIFTTWIFSGYFLQTADKDFWICGT